MPGVCRYYNTLNGCRFGDRCRYEHIPTTSRSIANGSAPCHFYRSKKGCRFGHNCHFSHDEPNTRFAPTSVPPHVTTPEMNVKPAAAAAAEPPVAAEAKDAEDAVSVDDSKAVVLYDPEVAEANLLKAALRREKKRKPGSELLMAQCSQCKKSFSSSATPAESCVALRNHYVEKLGKVDQKHVRFFNDNDEFSDPVYCVICERSFQQYRGLFRHMRAKMSNKKNAKSAADHKAIFEEIVKPFVERDTGYEVTEDDVICDVLAFMTEDDDDDYGYCGFSDSEEEFGHGDGLLFAMGLAHALRNRNNGGGRVGMFNDYDDDDDDDDDEYGSGMLGFTGSDCFELLCQGVKPWDEDAGNVLAALNGDCYW